MTLKLAFIGTGGIASAHLRGVAEANQQRGASAERLYELVALADPRPEAREAIAAEAETTMGSARRSTATIAWGTKCWMWQLS
jgi:predicted dehydrogenase